MLRCDFFTPNGVSAMWHGICAVTLHGGSLEKNLAEINHVLLGRAL